METGPDRPGVLLATAHPARFGEIVEPIVGRRLEQPAPLADAMARPRHIVRIRADARAVEKSLPDSLVPRGRLPIAIAVAVLLPVFPVGGQSSARSPNWASSIRQRMPRRCCGPAIPRRYSTTRCEAYAGRRYERAADTLRRFVTVEPDDPAGNFFLASCLMMTDEVGEAEDRLAVVVGAGSTPFEFPARFVRAKRVDSPAESSTPRPESWNWWRNRRTRPRASPPHCCQRCERRRDTSDIARIATMSWPRC